MLLIVLIIIAFIVIVLLAISVYQKSTNAICLSRKRLDGKTVIVTGGTLGIGLAIATDLAHRGAKVIIACPFEDEGIKARNQIINETENQNVIFKILDLASLDSTRSFAADILATEERLDILINNAAVGFPVNRVTKDGMSLIMQVNFYGTFLLTLLLLPLLKKTGQPDDPSRIVTTTSMLHMVGQPKFDSWNKTSLWRRIQCYGSSKLFLIYFASELTKRLNDSNVVINNVDPGAVGTRIIISLNVTMGPILIQACMLLFKTPWFGAQTTLHAALDKKAGEVSGAYFRNCEVKKAIKRAYDEKTAVIVWKKSVTLVQLTASELDQSLNDEDNRYLDGH